MPLNEFLQTKKEIRFEVEWTDFALTSRDGFRLCGRIVCYAFLYLSR